MDLTPEQWAKLFKVYMRHVNDMEGTTFLLSDWAIESVAKDAGIDAQSFEKFVMAADKEFA